MRPKIAITEGLALAILSELPMQTLIDALWRRHYAATVAASMAHGNPALLAEGALIVEFAEVVLKDRRALEGEPEYAEA